MPLLKADAKILAFGDSLTFGTGAADSESYPAVLTQLTGRKVINAGVPGEISAHGIPRLSDFLDHENPNLVILCHGANDLLAHLDQKIIADNLRTMIRMVHKHGAAVLLVAVPSPDITLQPPSLYEDLSREFNIPIEKKSLSHILGKHSLKSDYIHPNAAGYRLFAEALVDLLKESGALL
jgi:lysophospholipase L1-like esterase